MLNSLSSTWTVAAAAGAPVTVKAIRIADW